ncbi:hypothetical protein BDW59DRAFT_49826 [Aspergillus cavernicola]|uniref:FAD/NAD(P)-binding domain-containing protein n=1 Tax=Aspergillus cavernicola TaxID=176166 RepID=A0ABR4IMM4_9EURO
MPPPKKVAIIGAGPSGLVMAKTLLQNFPPGTFDPIIFEKKHRIGGLWAVDYPDDVPRSSSSSSSSDHPTRGFVNPYMRTNVSRFSVAFSDLSWESVFDGCAIPMFPRAWQVRRYLEKYAEVYVPSRHIRLGCRIVHAARHVDAGDSGGRWEVHWNSESDATIVKQKFDFAVVASGHFGTPHIPMLPGLDSFPNTVHSSQLQNAEDIRRLLEKSPQEGKLVVVGGSMSGVETAASLALHLSSLNFKPDSPDKSGHGYEVWHVGTSPFWVLPTYLPHKYSDDISNSTMPFIPLDLFLYDIDRRPPGDFAFGPKSPQQVSGTNQTFRTWLGADYGKIGGVNITEDIFIDDDGRERKRAPWVAISDSYAEFVRSGAIKIRTGKASSIDCSMSGHGTVNIQPANDLSPLQNVAAIVMATGFNPSESLSFFNKDLLSTLEYSPEDYFLPLILDGWSSSHSEIPDLGFVGFYRGAFWGPAELQAQSLSLQWDSMDTESQYIPEQERDARATERQKFRAFRDFQPTSVRGQFPLGDYVGLMESMARRNDLHRLPLGMLDGGAQPSGPVIPARYQPGPRSSDPGGWKENPAQKEIDNTMDALRNTLLAESDQAYNAGSGTAAAIFRALHGQWRFKKEEVHSDSVKTIGQTTFHPRYPSTLDTEKEYLCEEVIDGETTTTKTSIYRLREDASIIKPGREDPAQIHIWSTNQKTNPNSASEMIQALRVEPVAEVMDSGRFLIRARHTCYESGETRHRYEFYFDRVAIREWCCIGVGCVGDGEEVELGKTWYRR